MFFVGLLNWWLLPAYLGLLWVGGEAAAPGQVLRRREVRRKNILLQLQHLISLFFMIVRSCRYFSPGEDVLVPGRGCGVREGGCSCFTDHSDRAQARRKEKERKF